MEVSKLIDKSNFGEITAFIGIFTLSNINYKVLPCRNFEGKLVDYFLKFSNKEKLLKALQVVELSIEDLDIEFSKVPLSILNKSAIIEALLISDKTLIFDNINKGLTHREKENMKRVLKRLAEYKRNVIVLSNDIEFLFNFTKRVLIIKNDEFEKEFYPINWFENEIYQYVSKPPVIDFVMYCRSRNIKIEDSLETKELLKAIYRSVDK